MRHPDEKTYHFAAKISDRGDMSALCFGEPPRPINLNRASWTNREVAVTCKRCLAALKARLSQTV